ncbi:MAG TPA: MaoC family dehydratase [Anaeromyxobacteraceae bacterium]|nr:MaoC family dehydratase [Anaeromyxobacteraceae bacterium]
MDSRYLDDLVPGERFTTRGLTLTEAAIVDFAWRYDPQPFHLDKEAAASSHYGGLIASGLQTLAVCFRLFLETGVFHAASIGSPGFDELRWLAPVRPGDTLHTETEVLDVRPSTSKPDRGIARLRYRAVNQHGDTVLSFTMLHLLLRRPAS